MAAPRQIMADEHPLALELSSLKTALNKYQHAAHVSALQLQRAHLEASDAYAHSKLVEVENTRLKQEIAFLRENPEPSHAPRQVAELSLALRRVSDKLSHTEGILHQRTTELAQAISEKLGLQLEADATRAEADRIRQVEFDSKSRERDLQRKCKAAEEEARMADLVIMEYADLVRSLEGRISKVHDASDAADDSHSGVNNDNRPSLQTRSDTLIHTLTENRYSLQRLLQEFNSETSDLQKEITRLHTDLSTTQARLDAEYEISRRERSKLTEALVEVERYRTDDETAGKIVSRYMRFSQSSIDMLQTALSTLKSRHTMTLATISSSNESLSQALASERTRAAQSRDILDQLTEDVSRETFGRRREVSLRLRGVVREENISEALSVWLRRAKEHRAKIMGPSSSDSPSELLTALDRMIEDAYALHASLNYPDFPFSDSREHISLERVILAENTCRSLILELQEETEKHLALTKAIGESFGVSLPITPRHVEGLSKKLDKVAISQEPVSSEAACSPSPVVQKDVVRSPVPSPKTVESPQLIDDVPSGKRLETATISDITGKQDDTKLPSLPSQNDDEASPMIGVSNTLAHPPYNDEQSSRPSPFLDELTRVSHRYEQLQRAFRDCHSALSQLKMTVVSDPSTHPDKSVLKNVVHRLDDFCEDVRVELEIRMADEERITRGFETILRVPGAMATTNGEESRCELQSFLDGTAPTVIKTQETYTAKLEDLQHDIAQVKRAIHELEGLSEAQAQPTKAPVWSSWTPFLSTPPKWSSSPAPTFGTVITSPRSNHVTSFSSRSSNESMLAASDPYAHLGLRIPMPSQTQANSSPLKSPRTRRSSSRMYLLGLNNSGSGYLSMQDFIPEAKLDYENEDDLDTGDNHSDVE